MCSCAPFVGHIPPMSLQNPKFPSKLKRAKMADEAELFCISDSKTVVFARLLVSVNDLHRGLSSSVFRVEQMTQNQVPQGVPVRVRPPAPRCRSKVCSAQNPAAQNELPDFFVCAPLLLLFNCGPLCDPLRWVHSLSVSFLRSLRLLGSMIEP